MLQKSTLTFLKNLSKNNNKSWFDAHREAYDQSKADFESFVKRFSQSYHLIDSDIEIMDAKKYIFRINRDIRFSKDKTPYKNNFGASFSKGGKKSVFADYYMHIEPGKSFIGGGLWMPEPSALKKVRQELDYCWEEFNAIVTKPAFRKHFGELYRGEGMQLSKIPHGYEKDNPASSFLRLKHFVAMHPVKDEDITSPTFLKKTTTTFKTLLPMIRFLNRAVEEEGE